MAFRLADAWPPAVLDGLREFNGGRFFEAHEAFEEALDDVEGDDRWDLLVALIQVAVGYHKAASGYPGAERMLGLGLEKLRAFANDASGIDLGALRARVEADRAACERGEPIGERLASDPPRIAPVR